MHMDALLELYDKLFYDEFRHSTDKPKPKSPLSPRKTTSGSGGDANIDAPPLKTQLTRKMTKRRVTSGIS